MAAFKSVLSGTKFEASQAFRKALSMASVQHILFTILTILTVVTAGLFLVKRSKPQHELLIKIITIVKGWWMIFTVLAVASLGGPWGIWLLFLALSLYGVYEYLGISQLCQLNKNTIRIFYSIAILIFYVMLLKLPAISAYMFALVFQLFISTVLLLQNKTRETIPISIAGGFGVFTLVVALSSVAQIAHIGSRIWMAPDSGVSAVLILIILTSLNDVFQFIGGKLFGKRKVVPHLSPNKTEAGFLTGIFGTAALGSVLLHFILYTQWKEAFFIGLMIGFGGILGDLFLSAVKRSSGVKDFSNLIPGHGGILDRIDSLIFTAPAFLFALYTVFEVTL